MSINSRSLGLLALVFENFHRLKNDQHTNTTGINFGFLRSSPQNTSLAQLQSLNSAIAQTQKHMDIGQGKATEHRKKYSRDDLDPCEMS